MHETFCAETHVSEAETRPRRNVEASETLAVTLKLESLGSFNVSPRRFSWRMVKHTDNEKNIQIN